MHKIAINAKTARLCVEPPAAGPLSRRRLFAGAGTAGALAAVAVVLPLQREAAVVVDDAAKSVAEKGAGYQLTAHVQRYYQTAKV